MSLVRTKSSDNEINTKKKNPTVEQYLEKTENMRKGRAKITSR